MRSVHTVARTNYLVNFPLITGLRVPSTRSEGHRHRLHRQQRSHIAVEGLPAGGDRLDAAEGGLGGAGAGEALQGVLGVRVGEGHAGAELEGQDVAVEAGEVGQGEVEAVALRTRSAPLLLPDLPCAAWRRTP